MNASGSANEISKPERCGAQVHYEGNTLDCSLMRGHSGVHRNWVEDADLENETDLSITNETERW